MRGGEGERWEKVPAGCLYTIKKKVNSEPSDGMESKREGKEEKEERWMRMGETCGSDKDRETEVEVGETEASSRKSKDSKKAARGRQN